MVHRTCIYIGIVGIGIGYIYGYVSIGLWIYGIYIGMWVYEGMFIHVPHKKENTMKNSNSIDNSCRTVALWENWGYTNISKKATVLQRISQLIQFIHAVFSNASIIL